MSFLPTALASLARVSPKEWRAILWGRRKLFEIDEELNRNGLAATRLAMQSWPNPPTHLFASRSPKQIGRTVRRAARLSVGREDTCLRRSLMLWWILQAQGVEGILKVGVESTQGALNAHAWVEVDGRPVNDNPNVISKYQTIDLEAY